VTAVLDASAVLAFLQGESGATVVEELLEAGAQCSAVNWSEVVQKLRAHGVDWGVAHAVLGSYGLRIVDATAADAVWAAQRWQPGEGLSIADRFCLALGARSQAVVFTADTAWGSSPQVRQIR
jgi:PIN domain nuclease of toxin-antitoxin system